VTPPEIDGGRGGEKGDLNSPNYFGKKTVGKRIGSKTPTTKGKKKRKKRGMGKVLSE